MGLEKQPIRSGCMYISLFFSPTHDETTNGPRLPLSARALNQMHGIC